MPASIGPIVANPILGKVVWLSELLAAIRGVGLDVSRCPKVNSTTDHPWYQSTSGKWFMPSGTILAKITATGLYGVIKRLQTNGVAAAGQKDVIVDDADYATPGDVLTNGVISPTVDTIDYDTNTLTMVANLAGAGFADDAEIYDDTTAAGQEGVTGEPVILLEDIDYTSSLDMTVDTVKQCIINESAMPLSVITATMKTQLSLVQWR